jgi:cytochrome c nitrite reductase small subunit
MAGTTRISAGGLVLSLVVGAFVGLSAYTAHYANATAYLSDDPAVCVNCHVMREQYDAWQKSPHHTGATCNDCHVPHALVPKYLAKAKHGYQHSKAFTLQDFHEPIRITPSDLRIVEANCVRCHAELTSEIRAGQASPQHAMNQVADCVRCHSGVGHGPSR